MPGLVRPELKHRPAARHAGAAPFLKWAGGKAQLLPYLTKYVPDVFTRYIEPFVGGGALYFHLQPQPALLADANRELIVTYEVVRNQVEALIALLGTYKYDRGFYYELRDRQPVDPVEQAARFIYLNRTCFNGLYRVNKQGRFNVPFGSYRNPVICNAARLRACSRALASAQLAAGDYRTTLSQAQAGDFIYIDPPYHPISLYSDFKRYTPGFFYQKDQLELRRTIDELVARGCQVLASNSYSDFICDLYAGYQVIPVPARRSINKDGSRRGSVTEVVIVCR